MSRAFSQQVEEWQQWSRWNSPPGPTLDAKVDFAQKALRGLLATSLMALDEVEALCGRERWPMATELLQKIQENVGRFMQVRGQPFGDPDRKIEFLLDMLKQVMEVQLVLAKELEATQTGHWQNRIWTPDQLPRNIM